MRGKKIICVIVAALMTITVFTGCSGKDKEADPKATSDKSEVNLTGYPIVKEPITLNILSGKTDQPDFNEMPLFKDYEKKTNIHINWTLAGDDIGEKVSILLATNDLPDVIMKNYFSDTDLVRYGSMGTFVGLNDLIDKYAPNYKKLQEQYPQIPKAMNMGGNEYSMPYICLSDSVKIRKSYINKKWLDAVGIKMPTTLDEYYEVLKAFKTKDPNGNGKNDEIPLGGTDISSITTSLYGAFGLMNRGANNGYVDEDPKNPEKLRFYRADDNMKQLLQYVNKLYKEGLIDKNIFTANLNTFSANGDKNVYGAHNILPTFIGPKCQDDFVALDAPLKGPNGDQIWGYVLGTVFTKGSFVITKDNKYPEATMRWVDYFYSEEGSNEFCLGQEGKTYTKTADGKYELTDYVTKNPDGLNLDQVLAKFTPYGGGANPTVITDDNFKGAETYKTSMDGTPKFKKYVPDEIWEIFSLTPEEAEQFNGVAADLQTLITQSEAKFITGELPFSEWDNYVAKLKKAGMDEYVKIKQAAYDRYKK
jgi:putative aldouronate transport system substrate-binding protein